MLSPCVVACAQRQRMSRVPTLQACPKLWKLHQRCSLCLRALLPAPFLSEVSATENQQLNSWLLHILFRLCYCKITTLCIGRSFLSSQMHQRRQRPDLRPSISFKSDEKCCRLNSAKFSEQAARRAQLLRLEPRNKLLTVQPLQFALPALKYCCLLPCHLLAGRSADPLCQDDAVGTTQRASVTVATFGVKVLWRQHATRSFIAL